MWDSWDGPLRTTYPGWTALTSSELQEPLTEPLETALNGVVILGVREYVLVFLAFHSDSIQDIVVFVCQIP